LNRNFSRRFSVQNAYDDLAGLTAEIVVIQADGCRRAAFDRAGIGRDNRQFGLLRDFDDPSKADMTLLSVGA
jgi:hypothetical protein